MRVELLTSPGCPNAADAKTTVADCLTALEIDIPIIERRIFEALRKEPT
jgi:hypothetical protein